MKLRSIVFDLFGEYIRYDGGEIGLRALVELFAPFGIDEDVVTIHEVTSEGIQTLRYDPEAFDFGRIFFAAQAVPRSSPAAISMSRSSQLVRRIIQEEGFTVAEQKTRLMRWGRRQEVTGLVVNSRVSVPRYRRRFALDTGFALALRAAGRIFAAAARMGLEPLARPRCSDKNGSSAASNASVST